MGMKRTVLLAEDEERIRTLLTLYLEKNNYKVITASDGAKALQLIEEKRPDVVVLDILMPILSGIQVCKILRNDPTYQEIPILFLSSLNEKKSVIEGLDSGGDDYVTKPFDPNELVARVNALLRRSKKVTENVLDKQLLYEELTNQEMNILHLMEKGYTNKEIAEELTLTEGTVKVYNHHIYQKLQVKNRTQAIVKAKEVLLI